MWLGLWLMWLGLWALDSEGADPVLGCMFYFQFGKGTMKYIVLPWSYHEMHDLVVTFSLSKNVFTYRDLL